MYEVTTSTGETVTVEKGYEDGELVMKSDDGRTFKADPHSNAIFEVDPDAVDPETGNGGTVEELDDDQGGDPAESTVGTDDPQD